MRQNYLLSLTTMGTVLVAPEKISRRTHIAFAFALATFLFQLLANQLAAYGIFRDELYYLACADHLAWGYVDHPPLSVAILWVQRALLGDSLIAIRIIPALALAGMVWLSGHMVQRMGGRPLTVFLCCSALAFAPIYLAMGSYYSMNSLDILLWSACAYQLLRLQNSPSRSNWLLLGGLLGLGLLNKVSFLWLGAGISIGLLLSPLRTQLASSKPYLAAGLALLLFMPFILWNASNDWAHMEFARNAVTYKYAGISRFDFLLKTLLQQNPLSVFLWLPGLFFYFFQTEGKKYRILGVIFCTVIIILLINGRSKSEYLAPAFPLLFVGGALFWQQFIKRKRWVLIAFAVILLLNNLFISPLARPILPPQKFIAFAKRLGIEEKNAEGKTSGALPQFYADRFGWKEMAEEVASVYAQLSEEEKQETYAFAQNYGEAGALEYYRKNGLKLPAVLSGHNNYWLWGKKVTAAPILIALGGKKENYQEVYASVKQLGKHSSQLAMPYENHLPIFLCKNPRLPLQEIWPTTKNYN